MSYNLPIVATDVGDNHFLVKDGENGFLCEAGNVREITEKLAKISSDYHKRIEMRMKSYRLVQQNFSMQKYRERYVSFIESLA